MSHFYNHPVECKHCHKEGEMQVWDVIDVDSNPELRGKILNWELFIYHCPHCGEETGVPYGTIYRDMAHKFLIFFNFRKPDGFDYSPLKAPDYLTDFDGEYKFRQVYGWDDLREKILIFEQELNDIAIERLKYMQLRYFASSLGDGIRMYFEKADTTNTDWANAKMTFIVYDSKRGKTDRIDITMDKYYQYCLACELDPRMTTKGFCCIDEGWISKRFKEEE